MVQEAQVDRGRAGTKMGLTVIVATRDRSILLGGLLASLRTEWDHLDEVVVVVNGTSDGSLELAREQAEQWPRLRILHRTEPGKSRAVNHGVRESQGELLAFIDDDVLVQPGWAAALVAAFARHSEPCALQGRIRMPAAVRADAELMRAIALRRTHVMIDIEGEEHVPRALTGANMALRRSTLERAGLFNESLGPGAAGLCEDTDLAWRLLAMGGSLHYVPGAVVEHHFHAERLSEEYFVEYFTRQGRSRWVLKGRPSSLRVLPEYLLARARESVVSLLGSDDRLSHVRARRLHYKAMLDSARCGAPVPLIPAGPRAPSRA
jgi:GT2 family glycosyltransferase